MYQISQISLIFDIFYYTKYFLYFMSFLFILLMNILFYKITNNTNNCLINILYHTINYNGCILIKIIQWLITNFEILEINNTYILELFSNFYENCSIHDLSYTKKILYKEYNKNFDTIIEIDKATTIKSGSIAQVYKARYKQETNSLISEIAIKVVHPEIEYQMIFPLLFIKLYQYLTTNISYLKKYKAIFNIESFLKNIQLQLDMNNEFKNMQYFHNIYKTNPYIIIPKAISSTKNILIMEYIEGKFLDDFNISDVEKQNIITLMSLFLKDNFLFLDYFHADLHDSNWKICKYKDFYQIIIYDFGYVIKNTIREFAQTLIYNIDLNNYQELCKLIYNNTLSIENTNINISEEEFSHKFHKEFTPDSNCFNNDNIKLILQFCYHNNYIFKKSIFELFVSTVLFKNYVEKYLTNSKTNNFNEILEMNLHFVNFCKKYNIFEDIKNYVEIQYINNKEMQKNISITMTFLAI